MDYIGDSLDFVAFGIDQWLHNGWVHSYPAGHCRHRVSNPTSSGEKNIVAIRSLAGEDKVFVKEGGKHLQKDFAESFDTLLYKMFRQETFYSQTYKEE